MVQIRQAYNNRHTENSDELSNTGEDDIHTLGIQTLCLTFSKNGFSMLSYNISSFSGCSDEVKRTRIDVDSSI